MTIQTSRQASAWSTKTRSLAAGLLFVAALLAACIIGARPAHAETTLVVNDTGDFHDLIVGNGFCGAGGSCSLRAAIEEANSTPGAETINFDIPGTGVKTIVVNATGLGALPPITSQVTINGYTQTGASPNTKAVGNDAALKVELTQTGLQNDEGLDLFGSDSSGSVIKGLVINRFTDGIVIRFCDCVGNRIQGNFIGTDHTGTLDEGNTSTGVAIVGGPSENLVGGTTPSARNVISGNGAIGVLVGDDTSDNLIKGNYIGTDKSGTKDLGNDDTGVSVTDGSQFRFPIEASGNIVGGTTASSRNVVSGNHGDGIYVSVSRETKVLGNRVGTTADGKGALGNDDDGISVGAGFGSLIGNGTLGGSNTVAFNGDNGVEVFGLSSEGNEISHNSVFSNAGIGIDLGVSASGDGPTRNDPGDADSGPNNLQNKPVVTSAKTGSLKTTIKGKLESNPGKSYTVEFYANPSSTNEGKKFIGETTFTTSVDGLQTFSFSPATKVPVGQAITATATNASTHDTSEFSAPRTVTSS
jgi:parallel beta-helix repeat protein